MEKTQSITFKSAVIRTLLICVCLYILLNLFVVIVFIAITSSNAFAEDRGKKEFWISKYGLVTESEYTDRAHEVFKRVLDASDRRTGIEPAIYIIDYDRTPWAQSLADGSLILSKKGVEFCYNNQNPQDGDSRMAFVIGHELAHQFNGDFWHYRFLRTTEDDGKNIRAFQDIKELAKNPDMLLAKELQADQYGIIYATLAGYDSDEVVSKDKNFFIEWAEKETPSGKLTDNVRSLSQKRAKVVTMRLEEVASRIVLFDMGVISYHIGRFDDALILFKRFASYFPGREVYTNIGTIYLQMAYKKFRTARSPESFPFALSFGIDKKTRAEKIDIARGFTEARYQKYNVLLRIAAENLKKAIEYDPFYHEAKNNLGCAYIIENKYYDAVSILEDALKLAPDDSRIQNNLGIAYIMMGQAVESKGLIAKAEKILMNARDKNRKADINLNTLRSMYSDNDSIPVASYLFNDPFYDINIELNSPYKLKPGMKISYENNMQVLEEISNAENNILRVVKEQKEEIFLLTMGSRIRLVFYKEPSNLKSSIKGGDKRQVYISGREKNGIVLSENKSPDYFEF
jgi:tetratricopeptide (TPR) repeat protein